MSGEIYVQTDLPVVGLTTRIAPSPSGMFHIGTARTAYHNWLAARVSGGKFIVRIDDTNNALTDQKYIDLIYEALDWLGLDYDQTFRQSERLTRYKEVAEQLLARRKAETLDNGAIALKDASVPDAFYDEAINGWVKISKEDQDDAEGTILMRADGTPTYHFATVVDDNDCNVNFVIRGQDHVSNTPRQLAIYRAMSWRWPLYAHVGLIHKDKKKLSKRDGAASLLEYRDKGYDPDAILNYLLRLGWGPHVDDKNANYITRERALKMFFAEGKMRPSSANFDQAKLDWLDRKYKANKKKEQDSAAKSEDNS